MSVTSGFFNSLNHDRRYNAQQMSAIFDGIINDGVFANIGVAFAINADTGVTINIGKGRAWFNSAWVYNDALLPKTLEGSEVVLDRIDAVVIEVDHNEAVRMGDIKIVKGTPSSSPKRPVMVATDNKHQYPLAYIYRKAGSTEITQADITNMVGTSECPYITGILQVQNIDNIVAQWNAQWNQWYAEKIAETDSDASALLAEMKSEFDIWFADVQALLDDDVATALAAQVAALQGKFDDLARDGAVYDTVEDSNLDVILGSDGTPIEGKTVLGGNNGNEDIDLSGYAKKEDLEKVEASKLDRTEKFARNLLDNSDFTNPVNQRGKTTYSGAAGYTIDRWRTPAKLTVSVNDGYIKLTCTSTTTGNGMTQYCPNLPAAGTRITLAMMEADGTLHVGSALVPDSTNIDDGAYPFKTNGGVYGIVTSDRVSIMVPIGGSIEVKWIALYEGEYNAETLPEYQPKGYGAELLECQRYYWRPGMISGTGYTYDASTAYMIFVAPVVMRIKPTVTTSSDLEFIIRSGNKKVIVTKLGETSYMSGNCHRFSASVANSGLTANDCINVVKSTGTLELSADL